MLAVPLAINDVKLLSPKKFGDHRGFFSETYSKSWMASLGITSEFVQDNHSHSVSRGVVRGLHYQIGEMAQGKLVRVIRGAILDVAVDIRQSSRTFGQHVSCVISAENWQQIWVPPGFAHGFATLTENVEVIYKVTAPYSPQHERGILWDDAALSIDWQVEADAAILSDRDRVHPMLAQQVDLFK